MTSITRADKKVAGGLPRGSVTAERLALAAEVARLRDEEGYLYREIVERLGISYSYAQELHNDPDGSRARARKDSYRGVCVDCGGPTSGSEGKGESRPKRCVPCQVAYQHEAREWTRERIIEVFVAFYEANGRPPTAADRMISSPTIRAKLSDARIREAEEATARVALPLPMVVSREFGSWGAALDAAGLEQMPSGGAGHRDPSSRRRRSDRGVARPVAIGRTVLDDVDRMLQELLA